MTFVNMKTMLEIAKDHPELGITPKQAAYAHGGPTLASALDPEDEPPCIDDPYLLCPRCPLDTICLHKAKRSTYIQQAQEKLQQHKKETNRIMKTGFNKLFGDLTDVCPE